MYIYIITPDLTLTCLDWDTACRHICALGAQGMNMKVLAGSDLFMPEWDYIRNTHTWHDEHTLMGMST